MSAVSAACQGDQIGRIFVFWAIFFFGHFFRKFQSQPKFSTIRGKDNALIFTQIRLGHILGDFFANSSGHTAACT
jgi:hypothetical protein